MTDQPRFQRRKRRGAGTPSVQLAPSSPLPSRTTSSDIDALLAEKEALLQRKAELEAQRLRAEVAEAEREATALAIKREERAQQDADTRTAEDTRHAKEVEVEVEETAVSAASKPKPKPRKPLVLARAPEPQKPPAPRYNPESAWQGIDRFEIDPNELAKRNVITALRKDNSHTRFDILRTRMLQALSENGWKRVAITSPTKDCGKTFTAANLAMSLSRQDNCKTILLDLDMRNPSLHKIFGVKDPGVIGDMLRGDIAPDRHLQGFAPNSIAAGSHVAIGFNGLPESYAAELLQDPSTEQVLQRIETTFEPDVMLFDLPPALLNDDVLAMRPHIDALLIVAAGGLTKANDIKETERRLGEKTPLLGVVLNKAEDVEANDYTY